MRRLAWFLACWALPALGGAATLRNVSIEPAYLCPGQAFTVSYEASSKINTDLSAAAFISTNATLETGGCPAVKDYAILWASTGVNGSGAGVTPTSCVESYDAAKTIKGGDSVVAFRPYTIVARLPTTFAEGSTAVILLGVNDGYSSFGSWGSFTKLSVTATVDCSLKVAQNTGGYWYGGTNGVSVIIETDPAACGTPTYTQTITVSPTRTATRTFTPTSTPTKSSTATPTASPTRTPSPSASATPTATPSPTQSATRSATPSATPSPTVSFSPTQSATRTSTPTATPTPTVSFSPSPPFTQTNTPTQTESFTPSDTPTQTLTFTDTATRTDTPTASPSATQTLTPTQTQTLTSTPSETPTWTITPIYSPTNTPSFTATPSATPSFTQTVTFSPSQTLTGTPTASPTFTATNTFSFTPTVTPSATLTPSFTDSPTFTVSPTITPTPIPVPFQVSVTVYNAAGERVRLLFDGSAAVLPTEIQLDRSVIRSGLDAVTLDMLGALSSGGTLLSWKGQNDSGQVVKGGVYYFKIEYRDPFGTATSFTKSVQVLEGKAGNHLDIYNAAGELVYRADYGSLTQTVTGFTLDKTQLLAAYLANGAQEDQIDGSLQLSDGGTLPIHWDGRDLNGQPLSSGTYTALLVSETQQGTQVASKSITVIRAPDAGLSWEPVLGPNPLRAQGGAVPALVLAYPPGELGSASLSLYNQAGERVARAEDFSGGGRLLLQAQSVASGVYLGVLQGRTPAGTAFRRVLKVAIIR